MAIRSSGGPQRGPERVGRALSALTPLADRHVAAEWEAGGQAAAAPLSQPLPVYGADLESLHALASRKSGLEELHQTGWRYLVLDESEVQAADVNDEQERPTFHVGSDLAARIAEAGRLAESTAEEHVDYEPRLLDLGMLDASMLWLKSGDPERDLFFTLDAEPQQVDREQLLHRLASAAGSKLQAFDPAQGDEEDDSSEAGG
jgi:hypothetical protein